MKRTFSVPNAGGQERREEGGRGEVGAGGAQAIVLRLEQDRDAQNGSIVEARSRDSRPRPCAHVCGVHGMAWHGMARCVCASLR